MRVRVRDPRAWTDDDVATLRELADSAVTELELSALVDEVGADRVRWGLAIDAAGIGTFDWDLDTGRLDVGRAADRDVRLRRRPRSTAASRRSTRGCTPTTCPGDRDAAALDRDRAASTTRSTGSSCPTARPAGCTPAAGRWPAPTDAPCRLLGAAYDTTGVRAATRG